MSAIFVATGCGPFTDSSQSRGYNYGVTIFAVSERKIG
jgi:hypothetical protein